MRCAKLASSCTSPLLPKGLQSAMDERSMALLHHYVGVYFRANALFMYRRFFGQNLRAAIGNVSAGLHTHEARTCSSDE